MSTLLAMAHVDGHRPIGTRDERLASIVASNIDALLESRRRQERRKGAQERFADAVTAFSGSMWFVYLHALWFGAWIVVNGGWTPLPAFDEFPFGLLTMVVSLEAIFLATFVLLSQNRMQALADRRADLDLHINLLAEHEVTRLLSTVHAICEHLGVPVQGDPDDEELRRDISPDAVMEAIEERENGDAPDPEDVDRERPAFRRN